MSSTGINHNYFKAFLLEHFNAIACDHNWINFSITAKQIGQKLANQILYSFKLLEKYLP